MKQITGKFTRPNRYEAGEVEPAAGELLTLTLSQSAKVKQGPFSKLGGGTSEIIAGGIEGRIEIQLDGSGDKSTPTMNSSHRARFTK